MNVVVAEITERVLARLAPPPDLTVSKWADTYRYLSPESAAEPGRWKTLSFQRDPMDACSDPTVRRVVIKSATQMLKTATIENTVGYYAHQDPGPILVIQPGEADSKGFSKERIAPMIRDTPVLKALFSESKSRDSDNTINEKLFPGGMLAITGGGSPRNVARRAIRVLCCDEIDKYKPTAEGNVVALARKRLATFRHRSKEILTCSPTLAGSEIDRAYEASDKREFFIPCGYCGVFQSLIQKWGQVRWDQTAGLSIEDRARSAAYHCQECDKAWTEGDRLAAIEVGEWRPQAPFSGVAGFWISELYSPWKSMYEIALDFLTKKGNSEDLRTFCNTSLAENWQEKGEAPDDERLRLRAAMERYERGTVPFGVLFLTCGVDVQKTYLQVEIVGWGRGKESWSIDYRTIQGNPQQPEVWAKLDELLNETFPHVAGLQMPIAKMAVDTGYATNDVYSWIRTTGDRALAVDGRPGGSVPVAFPSSVDVTVRGRKLTNGLKLWPVATGLLKSELYGWLSLDAPTDEELDADPPAIFPPGYCHFPRYDAEFFKQLTAERLVARLVKGYAKPEWQKTRERNEALDCRVYSRAAAYVVGLDRFREANWADMETQIVNESARKPAPAVLTASNPAPPPTQPPKPTEESWFGDTSNWLGR